MMQSCENCIFWLRDANNCRRNPPKVFTIPSPHDPIERLFETVYPATDKTDWCGEWVQSAESKPAYQPHHPRVKM